MAKLYVIPVESACNASCPYCVNQFRNLGNSFLSIGELEKCLINIGSLDAIEISGGGEPTLHPQIDRIIEVCADKTRTQMYSNGSTLDSLSDNVLGKLNPLCISRAHFDSDVNKRIMGIRYGDEIFSRGLNIKLSAVLYRGGIDSVDGVKKYISWARGKAKKVVFRQLFEDVMYPKDVAKNVVPINMVVEYFFGRSDLVNPSLVLDGLQVEFETRSCSCENSNPILHANGNLNYSWSEDDINRTGN